MATIASRLGRFRPRTRGQWLRAILLVMLLAVVVMYLLAINTPGWYSPPDVTKQSVMDEAGRFEIQGLAGIHNALKRTVRGEQTFVISQNELNAFLAIRYATYSGSATRSVSGPMVIFSPGQVTLAARTNKLPGMGSGVLSLTGHVEISPPENETIDPSTRCRIVLDGVQIGSLPVPQALVRERISHALKSLGPAIENTVAAASDQPASPGHAAERSADIARILEAVTRGEAFAIPHRVERRTVFLKSIVIERGTMTVTVSPVPLR